jgi:hypothetical protein
MYSDKVTQSVAEAAKKVMEELKGNQHKIDKNKNNKIDAHDFKLLRKEEQEQIDELSSATMKSYVKGAKSDVAAHKDQKSSAMDQGDHKTASDSAAAIAKRQAGMAAAKAKLNKEETEDLLEYESKDGVYKHQAKPGRYGGTEKESDYVKGPSNAALKKIEAEKAKKKKKFSEMVEIYQSTGIKGLFEELDQEEIVEEATNDEFKKELDKAQAKSEGKEKADVAAAAGAPVKKKSMDEEVEQVDERTLTAAEADKKEDIVKGMKKGIAGFKERYGKDAKSVMYATATKIAKKD